MRGARSTLALQYHEITRATTTREQEGDDHHEITQDSEATTLIDSQGEFNKGSGVVEKTTL